jgi:hypothetical protein
MNKTTLIPITVKGGFLSTKRKLSQVVPNQAKKSSFSWRFLVLKDSLVLLELTKYNP